MRKFVICLSLYLGSAQNPAATAPDVLRPPAPPRHTMSAILKVITDARNEKLDESLKRFSMPQLDALAHIGAAMQKAHLPAPWMESTQIRARRLEEEKLPAACKTKCPKAESTMKSLSDKMTADLMANPDLMEQMAKSATHSNAEPTEADMEKMLKLMEPLMKTMMQSTFSNMCNNKDVYTCLSLNADACGLSDHGSVNIMGGDSVGMAKQYKDSLNCICDVCADTQTQMINFAATTMSAIMNMLSSMSSTSKANAASEEQMQKDLLTGMCPLVGVSMCFQANPTKCASAMSDAMGGKDSLGGMAMHNLTDLKSECDKHNIATEVSSGAGPVTTHLTLAGLDFTKVDKDATLKAAIIDKVKKRVVSVLTGYDETRVGVTLSSGSVKATVSVTPVPGAPSAALSTKISSVKDSISSGVLTDVKALPGIDAGLKDGMTKAGITATISEPAYTAPTQQPATQTAGVDAASSLGSFCIVAAVFNQILAWAF